MIKNILNIIQTIIVYIVQFVIIKEAFERFSLITFIVALGFILLGNLVVYLVIRNEKQREKYEDYL